MTGGKDVARTREAETAAPLASSGEFVATNSDLSGKCLPKPHPLCWFFMQGLYLFARIFPPTMLRSMPKLPKMGMGWSRLPKLSRLANRVTDTTVILVKPQMLQWRSRLLLHRSIPAFTRKKNPAVDFSCSCRTVASSRRSGAVRGGPQHETGPIQCISHRNASRVAKAVSILYVLARDFDMADQDLDHLIYVETNKSAVVESSEMDHLSYDGLQPKQAWVFFF